jgi:hypothetical protein
MQIINETNNPHFNPAFMVRNQSEIKEKKPVWLKHT